MKSENRERSLIGITMGDPCGIGPEVILKALSSQDIMTMADFVVIGCKKVLHRAAKNLGLKMQLQSLKHDSHALNTNVKLTNGINILDLDNIAVKNTLFRKPLPECGKASVEYVLEGLNLAIDKSIDAIVTAPISKEAVKMAGFEYAGHTELLKEKTASENVVMLMVGKELRVSFVTIHLAIKDVLSFVNQGSVFSTIKTTETGLRQFFWHS